MFSAVGKKLGDGSYISSDELVGNVLVNGQPQPGLFQNLVHSEMAPPDLLIDAINHDPANGIIAVNGTIELTTEAARDRYLSELDRLYVDQFGYGLTPEISNEIDRFLSAGPFATNPVGQTAGSFPGTHAEVAAVNAQSPNFGGRIEDVAVTSVWTGNTGGTIAGELAPTCASCAGLRENVDVLSN